MKKVINIQEAKTHLSRYVEKAADGEELVIGKSGKPMARLVPYRVEKKARTLGRLSRSVKESRGAWSTQTDVEIAADFLNSIDLQSSDQIQEGVAESRSRYKSKGSK